MKKLMLQLLLLFVVFQVDAQKIKDYSWDEKPVFDTIPERYQDFPAIVLKDNRWVHLRMGGYGYSSFMMKHMAVKINKKDVINQYNKVRAVNGLTLKVRDFHARIIKPNGTINVLSEDKIIETEEDKIKSLVFEGVEEGDILEYYYILKEVPIASNYEIFQYEVPLLRAQFQLSGNPGVRFLYDKSDLFSKWEDNSGYVFVAENIPAYKYEKEAKNTLLINKIVYEATILGTFRHWGSFFDAAFRKFNKTQISKGKSKDFLKDLKLDDATKSTDERLTILDNYIKDNFEFRQRGEASKIKELATGKQKLSSMEMVSLYGLTLQQMKIPFKLIFGVDRFVGIVHPDIFYSVVPHKIVFYIPETKKYITPTEDYISYGPVTEYELQDSGGVVYDYSNPTKPDYKVEVHQFPITNADYTRKATETVVALTNDGKNATLEKKIAATGYLGQATRGFVKELKVNDEKEAIEKFVKYIALEGMEIKLNDYGFKAEEFSNNYTNTPFEINLKAETVADFTESAGNYLMVNLGKVIGKQNDLYQETTRKKPIATNYAKQYQHKIVFTIPKGYTVESYKDFIQNKELKRENKTIVKFSSNVKIVDNQFVVEIEEFYNDINYPVSEYPSYREVINAAADFNKAALVLKPQG
ncbi:DUF3857 domain-containing protein [Flavobacterium sp.]|uniref:DUF3857 domain-containing protein n=1 Tax=Flavobacterium sp. TaxID=239 RepID=UPI002601CC94|nr:DUF3857 domain-containing protein [Flavobacterium sp.]